MINFPNAKINLGLNVIKKRLDGYHDIETCFIPIGWCDVLEVIEYDELVFKNYGLTIAADTKDNLCIKSYQLIKYNFDLPTVKIVLQKNIPMGAGLGGGSSNAAHMLKLLNQKFNLQLSDSQLLAYAEKLGSDCPFFIINKPCMGYEKGNVLKPINLNLKNLCLLVIYPAKHVSTASLYELIKPQKTTNELEKILSTVTIEEWKYLVRNDFEPIVFTIYPEIKKIKEKLYEQGALYAQMSGSGSSVFGIFKEKPDLSWIKEFNYTFWFGNLEYIPND